MPIPLDAARELAADVSARSGLPFEMALAATLVSSLFFDTAGGLPLTAPVPVMRTWCLGWMHNGVTNAGLTPREMASYAIACFAIERDAGHPAAPPAEVIDPCFTHIAELLEAEAKLEGQGRADA